MSLNHFVSVEHALCAGALLGTFMKVGIEAEPEVDDDHDYTDVIKVQLKEGPVIRVRVLAPEVQDS